MKLLKSANLFRIITWGIIAGTIITVILLNVLPQDYKPANTADEIKAEMAGRLETIAEKRDKVNLVSITPFLWDEGYLTDNSTDGAALYAMAGRHIEYKKLDQGEKRLLFFCQGQATADLIITKNEIDFDMPPGKINKNDGWLIIDSADKNVIRLYK